MTNESRLMKRIQRLQAIYDITNIYLKYHSKKYPEKMSYIQLLNEFCFLRAYKTYKKSESFKSIQKIRERFK